MIHGDLKGVWIRTPVTASPPNALFTKANILIDEGGHARLADFGLLTIVSDATNFMTSSSLAICGTTRWMSPELLHPDQFGPEDSRPTKESDCYALGMVIYEVLSGQAPFAPLKDFIVMRKVVDGERPTRPEGIKGVWFTDDLWEMMELCWAPRPENRPDTAAVLERLEQVSRVSRSWTPPSPQMEENVVEIDEDDWHLTLTVSDSLCLVPRLVPIPCRSHPRSSPELTGFAPFPWPRWYPRDTVPGGSNSGQDGACAAFWIGVALLPPLSSQSRERGDVVMGRGERDEVKVDRMYQITIHAVDGNRKYIPDEYDNEDNYHDNHPQ